MLGEHEEHSLHPCVALLDEQLLLGQLRGQTQSLMLLESLGD